MSRIHEALRKAAEERVTVQAANRIGAELVDLSPEGVASAVLPEIKPSPDSPSLLSAGMSVLPALDQFLQHCQRPEWRIDPKLSVFNAQNHSPAGAERFRTLRSRLYQIAGVQPIRKILVASSVPQEGKTFVTSNLAQSFVRKAGVRVLMIDADLRAPRLHLPFGAPALPGLADYLCGEADEAQVTQVGPDGNLCLISAGHRVPNPSELLHTDRMRRLLENMSRMFDWVILDSPPSIGVHDASILADMCDGVLFVVRAGSTEFELAEKASSEFREKNLLGVVLNRVDKSETYGYGYYYEYPADGTPDTRVQRN